MFKNTASQKLTVLTFADAGHATLDAGEKVTGDAANITLKIEQDDDGTRSASNDVNPTETEDGQYVFDLTQAETNGDKLTFYPESSTTGVQIVAIPSNVIYTRPDFSTLFAGITSLAEWLGLLAGQQAGDATARTELRATGAGAGAYDETTDSLEALRDHISDGSNLTEAGGTGDQLTAITTNLDATVSSRATPAQVKTQADQALVDIGLDHLVSVAVAGTDIADDSIIAQMVSSAGTADWDTFVNTDDSLQAISESGGGGPTAAQIADAVWDEAQADHVAAGSFGEIATEIASILVDTDEIGAAGAGLTEAGGDGDHLTAIPWNAAWDAEVESEVIDGITASAPIAAQLDDVAHGGSSASLQLGAAGATAPLRITNSGGNAAEIKATGGNGSAIALERHGTGAAIDARQTGLSNDPIYRIADSTAALNLSGGTGSKIAFNASSSSGTAFAVSASSANDYSGTFTAANFGTASLTADALATDAVNEIRDAITGGAYALDTDANGRARIVDGVGAGELDTDSGTVLLRAATEAQIDAIETDSNELQTDWADGGRLDLILDSIKSLLDDARAEPGQGAPPVNPDMATKVDYLYKAWRNKKTQTSTTFSLFADGGATVDQKSTVSDDGTTFEFGELVTGP